MKLKITTQEHFKKQTTAYIDIANPIIRQDLPAFYTYFPIDIFKKMDDFKPRTDEFFMSLK